MWMRPEVPTLLMTMMMMMNERRCLDWILFWSKRAPAWILHTSRRRVAHISRVNNDCILRLLHNISLLPCLRYLACFVRSNFRNSDRVLSRVENSAGPEMGLSTTLSRHSPSTDNAVPQFRTLVSPGASPHRDDAGQPPTTTMAAP
jgi:hypothetical protein